MTKWNEEATMSVSKYLGWGGVMIIVAGFVYNTVFAGIPYQDAPEYLLIEYNRHERISIWIINVGILVSAVGVLSGIVIWLWRRWMKS